MGCTAGHVRDAHAGFDMGESKHDTRGQRGRQGCTGAGVSLARSPQGRCRFARAPSPKWTPRHIFPLDWGGVPPSPMPGTPTGSVKGGCAAGDRLGAVVRDGKVHRRDRILRRVSRRSAHAQAVGRTRARRLRSGADIDRISRMRMTRVAAPRGTGVDRRC